MHRKYWEIIADNLSKAGWSWGCVSAIDSNGRTIWIADAHRGDEKRFVVRADEKLTAFVDRARAVAPALRRGDAENGSGAGANSAFGKHPPIGFPIALGLFTL